MAQGRKPAKSHNIALQRFSLRHKASQRSFRNQTLTIRQKMHFLSVSGLSQMILIKQNYISEPGNLLHFK
jgi:hypothetical protein